METDLNVHNIPNIPARTKKEEQLAEIERAIKRNIRERKRMEGGSPFGGRSTNVGSVNAQYRSHSPAPSYVLSPTTSTPKWNQTRDGTMGMLSNSCSIVALPTTPQKVKSKPSPLRSQLSDAELNERLSHGPGTGFGDAGGDYFPLLATPRTPLSAGTANAAPQTGWVSPLDVHFIRPSTPGSAASSVYRFPFPDDAGKGNLLSPASATAISRPRNNSGSSSIHSPITPSPAPKISLVNAAEGAQTLSAWGGATDPRYPEVARASPTFSPFPYQSHSKPQEPRFDFSSDSVDDRSASRGSPKKTSKYTQSSQTTPTPRNFHTHPSEFDDPSTLPEDDNIDVIRHSVVSKRTVSVHPALHSPRFDSLPLTSTSTDVQVRNQRKLSASSVHSTRTSILVDSESDNRFSTTSSYSLDYPRDIETNEISQPIPQAPNYLTTAQFSDSFRVDDENVFKDSPFSNTHHITNDSPSVSTSSNLNVPYMQEPVSPFVLELNLPDGNSSFSGPGRDSIGDFYDTYYRQSMARYSSEGNMGTSPQKVDVGSSLNTSGNARRPPPVKFEGGLGRDTITEVDSSVANPRFSPQDEMTNMI